MIRIRNTDWTLNKHTPGRSLSCTGWTGCCHAIFGPPPLWSAKQNIIVGLYSSKGTGPGLWIRIFYADPDPAVFRNADPDPAPGPA